MVGVKQGLLDKRQEYQEAQMIAKEAGKKASDLLKKLQDSCDHSIVAEAPSQQETMILAWVPGFRVCEVCGYLEENDGTGYHVLGNKKRVYSVTRKEGYAMQWPLGDLE